MVYDIQRELRAGAWRNGLGERRGTFRPSCNRYGWEPVLAPADRLRQSGQRRTPAAVLPAAQPDLFVLPRHIFQLVSVCREYRFPAAGMRNAVPHRAPLRRRNAGAGLRRAVRAELRLRIYRGAVSHVRRADVLLLLGAFVSPAAAGGRLARFARHGVAACAGQRVRVLHAILFHHLFGVSGARLARLYAGWRAAAGRMRCAISG